MEKNLYFENLIKEKEAIEKKSWKDMIRKKE